MSDFNEYFARAARRSRHWKIAIASIMGGSILLMSALLTLSGAFRCRAVDGPDCQSNWWLQFATSLAFATSAVSGAAVFLVVYLHMSYWRHAKHVLERLRYHRIVSGALLTLTPICLVATVMVFVLIV